MMMSESAAAGDSNLKVTTSCPSSVCCHLYHGPQRINNF